MQARGFEDIGELHLPPPAAVVTTPEELIESASLLLTLALFVQKLIGAALHFTQGAHVLLVKLRQVALVLVKQVR